MKLDIIVTHYNEPYEIVKPFFDMLELQRMVDFSDFRAILVHDGEDCWIPELSERSFPFEFDEFSIPHKGVSAARNAGMDYGDGEWIMFCDCDDSFANRHALCEYISALDKKDFQILWAPFYIEIGVENTRRFTADKYDQVRLVGKVFQRRFLEENHLRFSEDLWCGEDMAFMGLIHQIFQDWKIYKIGEIATSSPMYTVVPHAASVTHDPEKRFNNAVCVFRKQLYMAEELKAMGHEDDGNQFYVRAMSDAYLTLCRTDLKEDKTEFDQEVWEFYKKHRDYIDSASDELIVEVLKATYNEFVGTFLDENQTPISYKEWLPLWAKHHENLESGN